MSLGKSLLIELARQIRSSRSLEANSGPKDDDDDNEGAKSDAGRSRAGKVKVAIEGESGSLDEEEKSPMKALA